MGIVSTPIRVKRFDTGQPLRAVVRLANGHVKAPATLGQVGVLTYTNPDGSVRRELRTPEELFAPESLVTLELAPVTLGHPKTATRMVDSHTTSKHAVGVVGERLDHNDTEITGNVLVHEAAAIASAESGQRELSPGYQCELDATPGIYNGQAYDFVQRNIRYNHVAIVPAGRAGKNVRLHLDAAGEGLPIDEVAEVSMIKISLGGVEFEAPEQTAQAFKAELAKMQASASTTQARIDGLETELAKAKELRLDEAEVAQRVRDGIASRLKLERDASVVLGTNIKLDAMDERQIMEQVIVKASPGMADKLKGKDDAYVAASFDFALANYKPSAAQPAAVRVDAAPSTDARVKYSQEQRQAYLKPLTGGLTKGIN